MSDLSNHILPGHVRAFEAIRSQHYDNVTLWSCRINGEPGVAIVLIDVTASGQLAVMPLFVAITDSMRLEFDGAVKSGSNGGGGPCRSFSAAKLMTASAKAGLV